MPFGPLDTLNLLFLPLMVITAMQVRRNWRSLWDDNLTPADRFLLQRIVIFLFLPVVVLCHELGHVVAIKIFGGTVTEFHYSFLSGYVVPGQRMPPDPTVWMYFSGNLVQILIGLGAGALACLVSSPPVVALLIYLALWSVGGTVIVYALLSLTGLYGDWVHVYTSGAPTLEAGIGLFHLLLVLLVLWSLYGDVPKLWFISKTNRQWAAEYEMLKAQLTLEPTPDNWLSLAWSLYFQGLLRMSGKRLAQARAMYPNVPEFRILEATLADAKGKLSQAVACYTRLSEDTALPERLRLISLMALGQCQLKQKQADQALKTYGRAVRLAPEMADPHFFRGVLLTSTGRLDEAEAELQAALALEWLDNSLSTRVNQQLTAIQQMRSAKK